MTRERLLLSFLCSGSLLSASGCQLLIPQTVQQPVIRNPFPQLSRIAVAPFFNQSDESTVDGRAIAMAYYSELQATPGFEVVPVSVVEEAMIAHQIDLSGPGEARRLAHILEVDAVAVGSVTDFTPFYPPRCGLRVEWYTANSGYHEIPAGYGLPWNTPEEEFIPDSLVYESQMALARSEMQPLAPNCEQRVQPLPAPPSSDAEDEAPVDPPTDAIDQGDQAATLDPFERSGGVRLAQHAEPISVDAGAGLIGPNGATAVTEPVVPIGSTGAGCAAVGASQSQFTLNAMNECTPHHGPVLRHTQLYRGSDPDFTEALKMYAFFKDDRRIGGWQSYLHQSDDFIRVCCHLHISEMLSARGGSRKTRVVWRWPESR